MTILTDKKTGERFSPEITNDPGKILLIHQNRGANRIIDQNALSGYEYAEPILVIRGGRWARL